jgi:hypothetical protein
VTPSANDLSNVTYTWLVGGQDVQDGSSNAYTPTAADVGKTLDVLASFTDPVTHSVEHVTALGGTVDALPGLAITGTSATGSVPSSALTPTAASYLTADHDLINTLGESTGFGTAVLQRNDDGSSSAIDITPIFGSQGLNFFGHQYRPSTSTTTATSPSPPQAANSLQTQSMRAWTTRSSRHSGPTSTRGAARNGDAGRQFDGVKSGLREFRHHQRRAHRHVG